MNSLPAFLAIAWLKPINLVAVVLGLTKSHALLCFISTSFHSSSTLPIRYREKATKREFPDNHLGYDMVPLSDCSVSALTMKEVGLVTLVTQQMS